MLKYTWTDLRETAIIIATIQKNSDKGNEDSSPEEGRKDQAISTMCISLDFYSL